MDAKTQQAYDWALNQNHRSVAAEYAKTLAEYIKSIGNIEVDYPNWRGKFVSIAEAVKWHTQSQNAVISKMRQSIEKKEAI